MLPLNVCGATTIFIVHHIIYNGPVPSDSFYNISLSPYDNRAMDSSSNSHKTRQIYASVREDLYLAAKARATELRIPLRAFIEHALQLALTAQSEDAKDDPPAWDDVYLNMQAKQPLGSPVELTDQEAESVVRASFGLEARAGQRVTDTVCESISRARPMAELMLDTTVFHDYRAGDPGARAVIERIMSGQITASISPITVFELWGNSGLDRRTEIGYVGMLRFLEEASLSHDAAKVAGIWIAPLEEAERVRLARYAVVAATARERGEPICTLDTEPFTRFNSEVVGY